MPRRADIRAKWLRVRLPHLLMLVLVAAPTRSGGTVVFRREASLVLSHSRSAGWAAQAPGPQRSSVGIEYLERFADEHGDYLTVDLQARVSYDSAQRSNEAWAIEIHSAWLEYKLGLGRRLRAGHFAPAFGLEPEVDTHGTLLQTLAGPDIGLKKDWGLGYRGLLEDYDVEVAAHLGSGMDVRGGDGSHLVTARIWRPGGDGLRYGFSALVGRVLATEVPRTFPPPDHGARAVARARIGAAAILERGPLRAMGELSVGRNNGAEAVGALVEIGYSVGAARALALKAQARVLTDDAGDSGRLHSVAAVAASYALTRELALRTALFRDLARPGGSEETRVILQAYYYGE